MASGVESWPDTDGGASLDGQAAGRGCRQDERLIMESRIVTAYRSDRPGIKRTLCWDGRKDRAVGGVCWRHPHATVVRAVLPAACWKIRIGVRGEGEQRRYQGRVEEQQQRDGQEASHNLIVQSMKCWTTGLSSGRAREADF